MAGKVPGIDVSGVVHQVGSDVTSFQKGDHVFGRAISGKGALSGSLAEYTVSNDKELAKKTDYLSFGEAAALPTAYLTSLQALRDAGRVKEGSTVLIIGASGGCGVAGVQLAKAMGASRIVGICSGKNFEFVKSIAIGAGGGEHSIELVDYTDANGMKKFCEDNVGLFDCIYDTATGSGKGEDYVSSSVPKLLKEKTGQYAQINGSASVWAKKFMGKETSQKSLVITDKNGKSDLEEIATLLEKTGVKPHLDVKTFDAEGVAEGFHQLKGRRTKGKIVFNVE